MKFFTVIFVSIIDYLLEFVNLFSIAANYSIMYHDFTNTNRAKTNKLYFMNDTNLGEKMIRGKQTTEQRRKVRSIG